jgi:hypothetical protein
MRWVCMLPARHRGWDPVALSVRVGHPAGPLPVVAARFDYGVPYTDDRIAQGASWLTWPRIPVSTVRVRCC